ncbi:hypothetical protein FXO38_08310 [Capsicum annuum]|nr:hypothetical protein FXO38_08310 [Capsicum annuum]
MPLLKGPLTRIIMQWIKVQHVAATNWDQFSQWYLTKSKGKSKQRQLFKMTLDECIDAIWIERNLRIFEKRSKNGLGSGIKSRLKLGTSIEDGRQDWDRMSGSEVDFVIKVES